MTAVAGFDAEAVKVAAEKAIICAILGADGNRGPDIAGEFADAMEVIVQNGPRAVHVALAGWCSLILHHFAEAQGVTIAGGFWSLRTVDKDGRKVSVDKAGNPAAQDVMRIVTCLGNKDHDTIAAIVETAWDDGGNGNGDTLSGLMLTAVELAAQAAMRMRAAHAGLSPEQMLREFHKTHSVHGGLAPATPTADIPGWIRDIRIMLLDEEVRELHEAMEAGDLVKTADALADITYVLAGTAITYGIAFDSAYAAVPAPPGASGPGTRLLLLEKAGEEAAALRAAMLAGDITQITARVTAAAHVIDALAVLHGIPLIAVLREVHASNMTKTNAPDQGKLVKGPGYQPPRIAEILRAAGPAGGTP
jgi:predicted HAD superfamily Cof-like phosphohydrolase